MTILYRVLAGLVLLGGAFAAGWWSRPPVTVTKVETKVQTIETEKVITKVVTKIVVDPKTGETTTTETKETTADTKTVSDEKSKSQTQPNKLATATVSRRDWSVGLKWQPDWREDNKWMPSVGEVGYRAVADLWITAAYDWKNNHALLGVRWEW